MTMSSEVAALPPEAPKKAAGDSSDKEDEELEDESLVKHYLQVVKPTVNSKLHLPLPEYRINALGASRPVPKCGARGDYDLRCCRRTSERRIVYEVFWKRRL